MNILKSRALVAKFAKRRRFTALGTVVEQLESRRLFSGAVQHETVADLPTAAQEAVASAFGQEAELTVTGGVNGEFLGDSVSIDGDTIVVGAPGSSSLAGTAYVFTKPASGWANMTQTAQLTPSDGVAADEFGSSVSISGNMIVVGADTLAAGISNPPPCAAYVFTGSGSNWTQAAKLTPSDGAVFNDFGKSVSISGNTAVVSGFNNQEEGAAYIFTEPSSGWTAMTQTAELTESDAIMSDNYATSVSISGNTVVTNGPGPTDSNGDNFGAVYVFTEPGSGWANMTQTAELTASDGGPSEGFGKSVSISGNTVVAGSLGLSSQPGAAYVFTEPGSGWTNMTQTAELTASDGEAGDEFGGSVSISGNTVAVSTLNSAKLYEFTEPGSGWANMTQTNELTPAYGTPVAISGGTVVLGVSDAVGVGEAYVIGSSTSGGGGGGGGGGSSSGLIPTIAADTVPPALVAGASLHGSLKIRLTDSLLTTEKGFTVNLYASASATLDTSTDALIASVKKGTAVKPGKSTNLTIPIRKLPASLTNGTYYLIAETVDSSGNTPDVPSSSTVTVAAPFVSLAATAGAAKPVVIAVKKSGSILVTVTNNGNVNAAGSLVIALAPSSDGVSSVPGITLVTATRHMTIKPGKSGRYALHFTIPAALAAGPYYPLATITLDGVSTTAVGSQFTVE